MWNFISENFIGSMALLIMFISIGLQFSYIKFMRKSLEIDGNIVDVVKHKFWQIAKVEFPLIEGKQTAYALCFKNKKSPGDEVRIHYNPRDIGKIDKSVFITPLLKKFDLKKEKKMFILMKHQSPSIFHLCLIIFSLILLVFS